MDEQVSRSSGGYILIFRSQDKDILRFVLETMPGGAGKGKF